MLSAELAGALERLGAQVEVLFITTSGPLADRLSAAGVRSRALGFARGSHVLRHPRRFARAVAAGGARAVVLPECGFFAAALRVGGYRGHIIAVEHGSLLEPSRSAVHRTWRWLSRAAGARAEDVDVAVSDFMLGELLRAPHAGNVVRIYNGVDPSRFPPTVPDPTAGGETVFGFAGRLIAGKGTDDAIRAAVRASEHAPVRLRIAGDGPERAALRALVRELDAEAVIEFAGMVADISAFWAGCDVAVFPSRELAESFGMSALEAMACAKPVIATRRGALPELVLEDETGALVPPGSPDALSDAMLRYAAQPGLRAAHGAAGRARATREFHIDECARAYLSCLDGRS